MAEENVPAPAPTRSDEHILPFNTWLPVGKGAFTTSTYVPTIYIQQFWNTLVQDALEITPTDSAHPFVSPLAGDQANLNIPTKKPTPHVIPYCRSTKLIIYYLGSRHNIHRRLVSYVHVTRDDFLLGNLKSIPKGEKDEVFGKPIPQELITKAIQNSSYYQQYLEMVARKPTAKEGG
nr:histone deacetylase 14 [Tanacetum cinerariifolium]